MNRPARLAALLLFALVLPRTAAAQTYDGYTLYSKEGSRNSYLIDMNKTVVHSWSHDKTGGYCCYLLADGSLLRPAKSTNSSLAAGGEAGIVQRWSWGGQKLWEYTYSSNTYRTHHDLEVLPNGNVLCIAWEVKTAAQCVAAGLDHSASLWPDHIIEVQPVGSTGGNIVWEWHLFDHLVQHYSASKSNYGVIADHPELVDINIGPNSGDWSHLNSVKYNPALDQIIVSSHYLNEIYVIDHSTTTAQAASHAGGNSGKGGDILYRWGCPSNYGAPGTRVFDVVHHGSWIHAGLPGAGHAMAFNNRQSQTTSMVVELELPVNGQGQYSLTQGNAYLPASPYWSYTAAGFFSQHLGSAQRLPNGNTLIAQSTSGKFLEVTSGGTVVWQYQPGGQIPRVIRYDPAYSGLANLPVQLTSFYGVLGANCVQLHWQVASENMNYGFQVERSFDAGGAWEVAAFIPGRGTTSSTWEYSYDDPLTDPLRAAGTVHYRLRQLDTDGSATLSQMLDIDVAAAPSALALLPPYPNPVVSGLATDIAFHLQSDAAISLHVCDLHGREIATLAEGSRSAGRHTARWDTHGVAPGMYLCRLSAGGETRLGKVIVTGQ